MPKLIIVENPDNWKFNLEDAEVVTPSMVCSPESVMLLVATHAHDALSRFAASATSGSRADPSPVSPAPTVTVPPPPPVSSIHSAPVMPEIATPPVPPVVQIQSVSVSAFQTRVPAPSPVGSSAASAVASATVIAGHRCTRIYSAPLAL